MGMGFFRMKTSTVLGLEQRFSSLGNNLLVWSFDLQLGGLFGGAAVAWLVGPALSFQSQPGGGQRLLIDQPPLTRFMSIVRKKQHNS